MCSVFGEKAFQFFIILSPCCDLGGENTATLQIIEKRTLTCPCSSKHRHGIPLTEVSRGVPNSVEMGVWGVRGDQLHKHLFAILLNIRRNLLTFKKFWKSLSSPQ